MSVLKRLHCITYYFGWKDIIYQNIYFVKILTNTRFIKLKLKVKNLIVIVDKIKLPFLLWKLHTSTNVASANLLGSSTHWKGKYFGQKRPPWRGINSTRKKAGKKFICREKVKNLQCSCLSWTFSLYLMNFFPIFPLICHTWCFSHNFMLNIEKIFGASRHFLVKNGKFSALRAIWNMLWRF